MCLTVLRSDIGGLVVRKECHGREGFTPLGV